MSWLPSGVKPSQLMDHGPDVARVANSCAVAISTKRTDVGVGVNAKRLLSGEKAIWTMAAAKLVRGERKRGLQVPTSQRQHSDFAPLRSQRPFGLNRAPHGASAGSSCLSRPVRACQKRIPSSSQAVV